MSSRNASPHKFVGRSVAWRQKNGCVVDYINPCLFRLIHTVRVITPESSLQCWCTLGRAKAACLCSYCCNRHLCYDGGRLGRVKIVTLRVGARAKEGKRGRGGEKKIRRFLFSLPAPYPAPFDSLHFVPPLFEFKHALSRAKHSRARRKRLHCRLLRRELYLSVRGIVK